jgi:fumarate reductase subunit D
VDDDFREGMEDQPSRGQEASAEQDDHEAMVEEGRAAAILAYIPFLCFVPLIKMRDNPFALRHGKQGLLLFLTEVIAVFFTFDTISDLFWGMVLLLAACVAIVGIVYSVQGKEFTIPYIGKLADKLKI